MKVYAMVGDGLLEIDPDEWSDETLEVAVERENPEVVVLAEEMAEV